LISWSFSNSSVCIAISSSRRFLSHRSEFRWCQVRLRWFLRPAGVRPGLLHGKTSTHPLPATQLSF
jgi:hypothetical protein